jgi:hypothetical protein
VQTQLGIDIASYDYDVYNIEAEALGARVLYSDHHMPDVDRSVPLIQDFKDLDKIRTPDFEREGRFPQVIEMGRLFQRLTGLDPPLQFTAPFSLAANLRGIEPLLMDIYLQPDFARALLDRLVKRVLAPWIRHLQRAFPSVTSLPGADATASFPIVNMGVLRDWIAPSILRLRELCGPAVIVSNWVGERYLAHPEEMLDLKLQVCPDYLEGQDPDVETLGPGCYKTFAEERDVPLILGVGAGFLASATPEQVYARVQEYVQVGGAGGRFALYLCNLGATTPKANVEAALRALQDHGGY